MLAWLVASVAWAAPAPALTVTRCEPEENAPCWGSAVRAVRFAPPRGVWMAPVTADVRLGWQDDALLIRARGLPAGARVAWVLSPTDQDQPRRAVTVTAGEGVVRVPVPRELLTPGEHAARLALWLPDGSGTRELPWAPSGEGRVDQGFPLVLSDGGPVPALRVVVEGDRVTAEAPGADVVIRQETWDLPRQQAYADVAADARGADRVELVAPVSGWYRVEARASQGGPTGGVVAERAWVEASPAVNTWQGLFPAPSQAALRPGAPLRLPARVVVAAEPGLEGPRDLLVAELARVTGREVVVGEAAGALVTLTQDPNAAPEAFRVEIGERVEVTGGSVGAVAWGALAAVDLVGFDAEVPRLSVEDAPTGPPRRVLLHRPSTHTAPLDLDTYMEFLGKVVVRGRYDTLVLDLGAAFPWTDGGELRARNPVRRTDLNRLLDLAAGLGITVVPGLSLPAHAEWVLQAHPTWREDTAGDLVCLRHPEVHTFTEQVIDELWALFRNPPAVLVGLDELYWRTATRPGPERCPRCAGTPRDVLLEEWLGFVRGALPEGVEAWAFADMVLEGANGKVDGAHRALDRLPRGGLAWVPWSPLGDPLQGLAGWPVLYLPTGWSDWKSGPVVAAGQVLAGAGLGLYVPAPWSSASGNVGTRPLAYHWPSVLVAGAAAWRPALARPSVDQVFAGAAEATALRPGASPVTADGALALRGSTVPAGVPTVAPGRVTLGAVTLDLTPRAALPGADVVVSVGREVQGVALAQAVAVGWEGELRLGSSQAAAPVVAEVVVTWTDGVSEVVPLRLGLHTERIDGDPRARFQWRTAAGGVVASPEGHPERLLLRWDWWNHRALPVGTLHVRGVLPGVVPVVGGAVAISARGSVPP